MNPTAVHGIDQAAGLAAVLDFVSLTGLPVVGAFDSGAAVAAGDDYGKPLVGQYGPAWTKDPEEIRRLWTGEGSGKSSGIPIRRVRCVPGAAGFVVLDIDKGHADGGDGFASLFAWADRSGITFPADFGSVFTRTPSGGSHVWFRYRGSKRFRKPFIQSVEVFHFQALTVPGSMKPGKDGLSVYELVGDVMSAPILPAVVADRIPAEGDQAVRPTFLPPRKAHRQEWTKTGPPPLDMVAEWTDEDGPAPGRNNYASAFAYRAARRDYGYTPEDVLSFLFQSGRVDRRHGDGPGYEDEIRKTVLSAFQSRGTA